jgi:hypothetical protein
MTMRRFLTGAAAAAAIFAGGNALARAPAELSGRAQQAPAVDPVRQKLGNDLARLLNSEESTLAVSERGISEAMPKAMMADANVKALETQYPGIVDAMVAAMKPILMGHIRSTMPELWTLVGNFYASNLSEADLRAALAFYGSPSGRRIIDLMSAGIDMGPMLDDMVSSGKYQVTESNLKSSVMPAVAQVPGKLTPAEMQATMRFGMSAEGQRVVALTPRVSKLVAEWSNKPTPEIDAQLDKVLAAVVEKFSGEKIAQ